VEFEIPNAEDGLYEFEVRATNSIGQVEDFTGQPEAWKIVDLQAPFIEPRAWLPVMFK
jgi:hypothetical protein